jgi:hypothetical protein
MAKLIIKHEQAIDLHSNFYDKEFEVVKITKVGFFDNFIADLAGGGNFGGWEGLISTDGVKITFSKGGMFAQGKITQSWELSKNDIVNIKQGIFKTKIDFKVKQKGLTTTGLLELLVRTVFFGLGLLLIRNKRVTFSTRNEFDNLDKFQNLLAK